MRTTAGPLKIFKKTVYQTKTFTRRALSLGVGVDWQIVQATATHYTLFTARRHGLMVGQLTQGLPPGYSGPPLQFIYKTLHDKVAFLHLKVGGYSEEELAAIEREFNS